MLTSLWSIILCGARGCRRWNLRDDTVSTSARNPADMKMGRGGNVQTLFINLEEPCPMEYLRRRRERRTYPWPIFSIFVIYITSHYNPSALFLLFFYSQLHGTSLWFIETWSVRVVCEWGGMTWEGESGSSQWDGHMDPSLVNRVNILQTCTVHGISAAASTQHAIQLFWEEEGGWGRADLFEKFCKLFETPQL